ncbi:MAG: glycosyltransferase [Candidatus Eisenbacteria bacterium]|nr:glycosyltransferase [Candidatus Eisenbacteria bacterium]
MTRAPFEDPTPIPPATGAGADLAVDVSIVIVVYRTPDYLKRCLDAIEAAHPGVAYEVVVVDNAPADDRSERLAADRPLVRYHHSKKNLGFGGGANLGVRLARGRHFLILNPDVAVRPGSIEALCRLLDEESDIGIAAPRLEYPDGSLQHSVRRFYTFQVFLLRRTFLGKIFPQARALRDHLMLDWDHASTRDVDWCIGGSMMVSRRAVDDVGGMDERFFLYFEDVDWCYRMHQRGWRVVYHPAATMQHDYQRASAKGFWPKRGLWIHLASLVRFYEKWSFLLYWLKLRSGLLRNAALFVADLTGVVLAFLLAYSLRSYMGGLFEKPLFAFHKYYRFLAFAVGAAGGFFLLTGLYRERARASFLENLVGVTRALSWTSLVMMATTFLFSVRVYSRLVIVIFFPLAILCVTLLRTALLAAAERFKQYDLNLKRVGLIGPREEVAKLEARIERYGRFGLEPVPLLPAHSETLDDPARLARRVRHERVQEIVIFESWGGNLTQLVTELRNTSIPIRLVPRLHGLVPSDANLASFYGLPALALTGGAKGKGLGLGARLFDLSAAALLAVVFLLPFLLAALSRVLGGRRVVTRSALRCGGGAVREIPRLSGIGWSAHPVATWIAAYPALGALARSEVRFVGLYPFTESEWDQLDADDRALPADGRPGFFGPWTGCTRPLHELAEWNRWYAANQATVEGLRAFLRAQLGR